MTDNDVRRIEDKVDGVALILAELRGSLNPTLEKLSERQEEADKRQEEFEVRVGTRLDDFETRTRHLERFRYSVPSLALLSLIVSVAVLAYYLLTGSPAAG